MLDTIAVVVIVGVAITFVVLSFYRSISARSKGCACVDECPLSEACDPEAGECVENFNQLSAAGTRPGSPDPSRQEVPE